MIENEPQKSTIDQRESAKQQSSNETEIDVSTIQSHSMQNSKYEMLSGYLDGELTQ